MAGFFGGLVDKIAQHPEQNPQAVADAVLQLVEQTSEQRPLRPGSG